ncbi:toxin-antitoxin system HicB family antitoxin [Mesorhizobium sp. GbtcB19]|uniref:toxin-antitoxin system HicB family antitoxin n=1 Tax=Mesorhizobium sp. GbtcB19 TaxID=2824764 RepID=UPI001C30E1A0|nr:toxin-antitoxin system HicB family antitoxin [Mesorhizobium sp. GbtcB19]
MSKATYPLRLLSSVKEAAVRLAKADGVSLNQWIVSAVAQKVGAMETAADFLRHGTGNASGVDFAGILDQVTDAPLQSGDERPSKRH